MILASGSTPRAMDSASARVQVIGLEHHVLIASPLTYDRSRLP